MKKIFLIFVSCLVISACSSNDEDKIQENALLKEKLMGTWKYDGYYEDVPNPNPVQSEAENFYSASNDEEITYYTDTFAVSILNEPTYSGNYTISNDSLLSHNNETLGKIFSINETRLIISHLSGYSAARYSKVKN
jgi:hypothetical protein